MNKVILQAAVISWGVLLGTTAAHAQTTFSSNDGAFLPRQSGLAAGNASLYPIPLTISGVAGNITSLKVRLDDFSHARPSDLDMVLVSPLGHAVVLMSDAGGNQPVHNLTITFQDGAPAVTNVLINNSTVSPADYEFPGDTMSGITNVGETQLRTFAGSSPNGTWKLYITDDGPSPNASDGSLGLLIGYSLIITTSTQANRPPTFWLPPRDPQLPEIPEDSTSSQGVPLATLMGDFVDPDATAVKGAAIVAHQTGFQYSKDSGATWVSPFPTSESNALLLPAAPTVWVRFLPPSNVTGLIYNIFSFRAWDRTEGAPFSLRDINAPNSLAFSAFATNAFIRITNVNDAPVIAPIADQMGQEDATFTMPITVTDPDNGQVPTATVGAHPGMFIQSISLSPAPNRVLTVVPRPDAWGNEQITITATDGAATTTLTFSLTFAQVNDAPVITATNVVMDEDTVHTQAVTVTDIDTAIDHRVLTVEVANTTLFPPGTATITGANRLFTVRFQPPANVHGSTTFTLRLDDLAGGVGVFNGTITINPVNDAPLITVRPAESTQEDQDLGPVIFTIQDVDDAPTALTVTGNVMGHGNMITSGTGTARSYTYSPAPNQSGLVTLALHVVDPAGAETMGTVNVTVLPVNDPPTLGAVGSQTMAEDTTLTIPLSAFDVETPAANLVLSAMSSRPDVVGSAGLRLTGGAMPMLTVTPLENAFGNTQITVTLQDDGLTTTTTFDLLVTSVDDPPVINAPADTTIPAGQRTSIPFTVADVDSPLNAITFLARTTNDTLFPAGSITFEGTDANRTIHLQPAGMLNGTTVVTVVVDDGSPAGMEISDTFSVTVTGGMTATRSSSSGGLSSSGGAMGSSGEGSSSMEASSSSGGVGSSTMDSSSTQVSSGEPVGSSSAFAPSSSAFAPSSGGTSSGATAPPAEEEDPGQGGCNSLAVAPGGLPLSSLWMAVVAAVLLRRRHR